METNAFTIDSYDYFLPESLIAQTPIKNRDDSKLMVLDKISGNIEHSLFKNILNYLKKGDVLVLNNTKVLPSRLFGIKEETNAKIEVLLLKEIEKDVWECLVSPQKRLKINAIIKFSDSLKGRVIKLCKEGITHIKMDYSGIFLEIIQSIGAMPIPPYIHKTLKDNSRYQTVYAKNLGSAAAPTAGLHFTEELLTSLEKNGIEILYVTLHVGLGTFKPVNETDIKKHYMHSEYYIIDENTAQRLNNAKNNGKRIISVGTTSLRTLESNYKKYGEFKSVAEETSIFVYPGYNFKAVDSLITNFHLPKSTLLMLVSALSSRENILKAYNEAIKENYRFFSFGDAMFITDLDGVKNTEIYRNILKEYKYKKPYIKSENFKIYKGNNNILISAPHAYKHLRNGKYKKNEYNTSNIVKLLNYYTDSHIIYTYKSKDSDHNFDKSSSYKSEVVNYIKSNNINFFIDVHGLEDDKLLKIIIGTNDYQNINGDIDLANKIKNVFKTRLTKHTAVDEIYKAKKQTLCYYVNDNANIKAIQLEISKKYRKLKRRPQSFNKLVITLIKIINELKEG